MRLLVDANLSPTVAADLRRAGVDATHVADHGLISASDEAIAEFAVRQESVAVSADSDFATLLALGGKTAPSLVLLRSADHRKPHEQAALLRANLPTIEPELESGAVVSISQGHLGVRRLPMGR